MTMEQQLASDYSIEYLQTGNTISQRPRLATECAFDTRECRDRDSVGGENPHLPSEGGRQLANLYIFLDRPATSLVFSKEIRKYILRFSTNQCNSESPLSKDLVLRAQQVHNRLQQPNSVVNLQVNPPNPNNPEEVSNFLIVLRAVCKETKFNIIWLCAPKPSLNFVLSTGSRLRGSLLVQRRDN
ncbi:hypothetical protein TWF217_012058 [Orbilia oligospora]|nr:hypothetical protein TWF217_012058 [Orbilia oligospora]